MPYAGFDPDCDVLNSPEPRDLVQIAAESGKAGLIVFGWRFSDMRELAVLPARIRTLKMSGAPKLTSLDGIQALQELREFVLMTPTGSSGARRLIKVASFAPLERLAHLERLLIHEVRPDDLDLSPIARMTELRDVDVSGVPEFGIEEYARLAVALPSAKGRCLQPYFTIKGVGYCKKCKGQMVLLVGAPPRSRRFLCPQCNQKLLAAHVAKWEQVTGRRFTET